MLSCQPRIFQADQSKEAMATLVSKTVEYVQSRHSPEDRVGSREAQYERDSVEGPLGSGTPETRKPPHSYRYFGAEEFNY